MGTSREITRTMTLIAGVDEVGRGCLAGPVVACACIVKDHAQCDAIGLKDSKVLSRSKREHLFHHIARACTFSVGVAHVVEIDKFNILTATLTAMKRAVLGLGVVPDKLHVDGNQPIPIAIPQHTIIRGDQTDRAIQCAAIVAKVVRDRLMMAYNAIFPIYGFDRHVGYATAFHRHQLTQHGPTPIHRKSFAQVKKNVPQTLLLFQEKSTPYSI